MVWYRRVEYSMVQYSIVMQQTVELQYSILRYSTSEGRSPELPPSLLAILRMGMGLFGI